MHCQCIILPPSNTNILVVDKKFQMLQGKCRRCGVSMHDTFHPCLVWMPHQPHLLLSEIVISLITNGIFFHEAPVLFYCDISALDQEQQQTHITSQYKLYTCLQNIQRFQNGFWHLFCK